MILFFISLFIFNAYHTYTECCTHSIVYGSHFFFFLFHHSIVRLWHTHAHNEMKIACCRRLQQNIWVFMYIFQLFMSSNLLFNIQHFLQKNIFGNYCLSVQRFNQNERTCITKNFIVLICLHIDQFSMDHRKIDVCSLLVVSHITLCLCLILSHFRKIKINLIS